MSNLIDLLNDCRTALVWLKLVEDSPYYKECIQEIIKKVDVYIEKEIKDKYN